MGRRAGDDTPQDDAQEAESETPFVYVYEGWWHYNVKAGQVHEHPERPGGGWSAATHRLCEPVYTRRPANDA